MAVTDEKGKLRFLKIKIENSYWYNAIEFTKSAANLSILNEKEFIEKYIINECERMVNGLEQFYNETEFEFNYENRIWVEGEKVIKYRVDFKGFELIDFRTEKIVGALDFITKINKYNSIVSTNIYAQRIIDINKKFIPNVYIALSSQNIELKKAKKEYDVFILNHNKLLKRDEFFEKEKLRLKTNFEKKYGEIYTEFCDLLLKSHDNLRHHIHKVKLHKDSVKKLSDYIGKYQDIVKNN
jgi:hypothetical protein